MLVGAFLFGVGTLGMFAVASESSSADSPSYSSEYTDTDSYSTDGSSYSTTSSTDTSTSSETSTTSSTGTSTTDTSTEASEEIDAGPRPVAALGDNPFNTTDSGAVNTSCELPEFATDTASQDAFYQAAARCLMRAWTPALRAANLPVEPPKVITSDSDMNSPCGKRSWRETAMYCGASHTIYMTAGHYAQVEGQTEPGVYLGQFSHEFGHAIQGMTGIMSAYSDALYDAGGIKTSAGLELSRKTELQATCFEGMALAAFQNGGVSNDYIFPALEDSEQRGDAPDGSTPRDHGSLDSNNAWVNQGFKRNEIAQCNTWLADANSLR